jgi:hypothetical protein
LARTTNCAEVWHKKMKEKMVIKHPNIAYYIIALVEEKVINMIKLLQSKNGNVTFSRANYIK